MQIAGDRQPLAPAYASALVSMYLSETFWWTRVRADTKCDYSNAIVILP
jgi:hypothetical protein